MKNLSTGYFARASQNGLKAMSTKVHLVGKNGALCGYQPHKTLTFQFNARGAYLPYVECDKCKNELKYYFEVGPTHSAVGSRVERYFVEFYNSTFGISVKDIIKNCDRPLESESLAYAWAKKCVSDFKRFLKKVNKNDSDFYKNLSLEKNKLEKNNQRDIARKILWDKMKLQGQQEVLWADGKFKTNDTAIVSTIIDAMVKFKNE